MISGNTSQRWNNSLQHIAGETIREIKIDSKCRIYDKVAVKNQSMVINKNSRKQ